jgi:spore coat polysaccharide biosynthesis predicted glycosyltransferase SpsG
VIRADADDFLIGKGHLKRMIALAGALCNLGARVIFFVRDSRAAHQCLKTEPFPVRWLPLKAPETLIAACVRKTVAKFGNFLILDLRRIKPSVVALYARDGGLLFVVSDAKVSKRGRNVRFLYCHECVKGKYPFPLIAPRFAKERSGPMRSKRQNSPQILVSLGGSDPTGTTCKVVASLLADPHAKRVHVVISGHYVFRKEFYKVLERTPKNVRVYQDVRNMAALIRRMDCAIIGGGMIRYETACLGVPSLVLAQNQEQARLSRRFCKTAGFIYGGFARSASIARLQSLLNKLLHRITLKTSRSLPRSSVDGQGVWRLAKHMMAEAKRFVEANPEKGADRRG